MVKKITISLAYGVFIVSVIAGGTFSQAVAGPAAFLEQGVGARAMGMGGAFTAVSDDPSAAYWNPAGLGALDNYYLTAMIQRLAGAQWPGMEDIRPGYQFFNLVMPLNVTGLLGSGSASLSFVNMKIDNIPLTGMDDSGALTRESFSNKENAVILSAGYPFLGGGVLMGGSVRYISQDFVGIQGASASGWDIQLGKILPVTRSLSLGLTMERGPVLTWENGHRDTGGIKTKLGLGYRREIAESLGLLSALDLIQKKDMPLQASAGTELSAYPQVPGISEVSARAGVNRFTVEDRYSYRKIMNESLRWSMGLGIKAEYLNFNLMVDYAFTNDAVGNDHLLSLTVRY